MRSLCGWSPKHEVYGKGTRQCGKWMYSGVVLHLVECAAVGMLSLLGTVARVQERLAGAETTQKPSLSK